MKTRQVRLTRQDVFAAADEVLRQGKKPSIESVLAYLQRGSPNTAGKYLNAYWASLYARLQESRQVRARIIPVVQELLSAIGEEPGAERATFESAIQAFVNAGPAIKKKYGSKPK